MTPQETDVGHNGPTPGRGLVITDSYRPFDKFGEAYDVFTKAAQHKACRVVVQAV